MGPIEDFELVQKIRSGQRGAFADLVRKYQKKVLGFCISLLSDLTQAEDAAQEIFIKAYQSLDNFRGKSSFFTWLYRIASNHCLDLLRKRSRQKTESWEALLEREGERLHRLLAVSHNPESPLEESDLLERVLSQLSPDYRIILTLREVQGFTYQEIADILDCSLDAVKARLRRARQELEEKLRHFLGSENV